MFVGMFTEILRYIVSLMIGFATVIGRIAGKQQPVGDQQTFSNIPRRALPDPSLPSPQIYAVCTLTISRPLTLFNYFLNLFYTPLELHFSPPLYLSEMPNPKHGHIIVTANERPPG